ncbi:N-acyl-D-amino-acid deacylase family protein [Dongia deserti]|uniref:N-acyl-D-amino-acid deacylase family protein n=1 Tax=Dongia deserti TaxID=2268030 RepID=UPI000E64C0F0|nr:D-aminoacylase [Dongia deserti]
MTDPDTCDLLIQRVSLFDGSGAPPYVGDLAVIDDKIVVIGDLHNWRAREKVDGQGLALAPGFIDVHTHDDRALLIGDMANKTSQGVTSVVVGNCGISLAPLSLRAAPPPPLDLIGTQADYTYPTFAEYMDALDRQPPAVNAACLVGHSTLRVGTMDRLDRPATSDEIAAMRAKLQEALEAGAIGLSTGLDYQPAEAAPTEEVQALAQLLKPAGAIHTTHMRSEGDHVTEAMDEAFAIGKSADVPVVISHFKVHGKANFGRSVETLAKFDTQRLRQPLGLDAYPYSASSTVLKSQELSEAPKVMVTWSTPHPEATGRMLDELATEWGCSLEEAAKRLQPAGAVYFAMDEADVRRILSYPHTMIGSDGLPHDTHPHPRLWGSFPRVLGHYAREVGLFPMEEAIRRMTSLPAERFGLTGRGRLKQNYAADLVLFDPQSVKDRATFENPKQVSDGIVAVWVNGKAVWRDGRPTGARPGRALRRQQMQTALS